MVNHGKEIVMKKWKSTVMGVTAASARPDWRGYLVLGIVLSGPFLAVAFGVEFALRWGVQP